MDLFGHLNNLIYKNKTWGQFTEEDRKTFNVYMINKFISMSPDYTGVVDIFQRYSSELTPETVFKFYYNFLPKKKTYFRYIKGKKQKTDSDIIDILSKHFECSKKTALEYLDLISKEYLKEILNLYGYKDPVIKKKNAKKTKSKKK
jgi:hypothetical protein